MRKIKKASTNQSVVIRIVDSSDGTPENGVEHDTAGIDLWYRREEATKTSITEVALAGLDAAHADGGIELIGDGYYRLDPPDAAFATGANGVAVGGTVTGMVVIGCYVHLVDYDPQDSVRAGLTALPNAAPNAALGLLISTAGGLDMDAVLSGHTPQTGDTYAGIGATALAALQDQYDGTTGLLGDLYPATQAQLQGIANVGAATNEHAIASPGGFVLDTGTNEVNNEDDTHAIGGNVHSFDDDAGTMAARYRFDNFGAYVPVSLTIHGRLNGSNDEVTAQVNTGTYAAPSWQDRDIISGNNLSVNTDHVIRLYIADVLTGADAGKLEIRLYGTGLTSATMYVDQITTQKTSKADNTGYANGISFNDTAGNTNTVPDVDGTARNPVSTWAAVKALMASTGLKEVHVANGSQVDLDANSDGLTLLGKEWTLTLGTQSIEGLFAEGAQVSGIGTATVTMPRFEKCGIGAVTMPPAILRWCGIGAGSGQFTARSAGQFYFVDCVSMVPGSGSPAFVFTGLGSTTGINVRRWSGGANFTLDSDCTLSHEVLGGGGASVTTGGADVEIRGITRSITLVLSGAGTIQCAGITGPITISGTTTAVVKLYGISASLDDTSVTAVVTDHTIRGPDVTGILADTAEIGTAGAGLSDLGGMSTGMKAEVNAECDTALSDYAPSTHDAAAVKTAIEAAGSHLTLIKAITDLFTFTGNDVKATLDGEEVTTDSASRTASKADVSALALEATLTAMKGAGFAGATDSLEALRNRGDSAWLTATGFSTHDADAVVTAMQAAGTHLTLIKAVTDVIPDAGAMTDIGTDTARLTSVRAAVLTDWINGGRLDVLLDAIKAVTDALTAAAAAKLAISAGTMVTGTVSHDNTAASTTVFYCDDIVEPVTDHFKGRNVYFTSGALDEQGTEITGYELSGGEGKFTVEALTSLPADNVTFVII